MRRLRILTWQVHGNYLYYLTQAPHEFFVLSKPGRPPGYGGRNGSLPWGDNVHDCPVRHGARAGVRLRAVPVARALPEGSARDPVRRAAPAAAHLPRARPAARASDEHRASGRRPGRAARARHALQRADVGQRTRADARRRARRARAGRHRRGPASSRAAWRSSTILRGADAGLAPMCSSAGAREVPLDLYGMDAPASGGLCELPYAQLLPAIARHRFYAHPGRYTSLALALCEAMMIGLPVIGLATTELPRIIQDSGGGYVDNDVARLVDVSRELLRDAGRAAGTRAQGPRVRARAVRHRPLRIRLECGVQRGGTSMRTEPSQPLRVLVTGGAGFLGSHLCERLLDAGHDVLCVDNFYTGTRANVAHLLAHPRFELLRHDITFPLYVEVDRDLQPRLSGVAAATTSSTRCRRRRPACTARSTCSDSRSVCTRRSCRRRRARCTAIPRSIRRRRTTGAT